MTLLETVALTKNFFGVTALDKVDFQVNKGEIVGLIGPNGSGKTTLFNCATGVLPVSGGSILFKGEDITDLKTHEIALKGISHKRPVFRQADVSQEGLGRAAGPGVERGWPGFLGFGPFQGDSIRPIHSRRVAVPGTVGGAGKDSLILTHQTLGDHDPAGVGASLGKRISSLGLTEA